MQFFAQIDQTEDRYHAYVRHSIKRALIQADVVQEKIDKGELTGALAGVFSCSHPRIICALKDC